MALFDNTQVVSITITANRRQPITTGKEVSESRQFIITDFYTEEQLKELVTQLTPTEMST
jgi:hypothetical protein